MSNLPEPPKDNADAPDAQIGETSPKKPYVAPFVTLIPVVSNTGSGKILTTPETTPNVAS
ncbi:MAG: hypothetical protein ACPGU7_00260 [Gammaproteobacteria bacterium]